MEIGQIGLNGVFVHWLVEQASRSITGLVTVLLQQMVVKIALGILLNQKHAIKRNVQLVIN